MTVVAIVLFVAFLWWANTSSTRGQIKRSERAGDSEGAVYHSRKLTQVKAGLVGLVIGAVLGSFIGIAGFGNAIAGTIPVGLIMGIWFYCANDPTKK